MRIHACSFFSLAHLWLASFAVFSSASIDDCLVLGLAPFCCCVCSFDVADVQLWPGELHVGFFWFVWSRFCLVFAFDCLHCANDLAQIVSYYRFWLYSTVFLTPFHTFLCIRTVPQCNDGQSRGKKMFWRGRRRTCRTSTFVLWQKWHFVTLGWLKVALGTATLCVAGVVPGNIYVRFDVAAVALGVHLRFAWQPWQSQHWTGSGGCGAFAWQAWR